MNALMFPSMGLRSIKETTFAVQRAIYRWGAGAGQGGIAANIFLACK